MQSIKGIFGLGLVIWVLCAYTNCNQLDEITDTFQHLLDEPELVSQLSDFIGQVPSDHRLVKNADKAYQLIQNETSSSVSPDKSIASDQKKLSEESVAAETKSELLKPVINEILRYVLEGPTKEVLPHELNCEPCEACHDLNDDTNCVPCPKCSRKCAACIVSESCPPIEEGETKCPPRPSCSPCKKPTIKPTPSIGEVIKKAAPAQECQCKCGGQNEPFYRKYSDLVALEVPRKPISKARTSVSDSNASASSSIGIQLYQKLLEKHIKDEKLRTHFEEMINSVARYGDERIMSTAEYLLTRLGEKRSAIRAPESSQSAKSQLTLYMSPREAIKAIIGFTMERAIRKRCKCKSCPVEKVCSQCKLPPPLCASQVCNPCPSRPICPAPAQCKKHAACKVCPDDPDDDGDDPKELDEIDLVNPVSESELNKIYPCIGSTCDNRDCGLAPLNPLTPHRSVSTGYMNGGEDSSYGEWPSYVRIDHASDEIIKAQCGGVLISKRHVLTAAHCFKISIGGDVYIYVKASDLRVVLGDQSLNATDSDETERKVTNICLSNMTTISTDVGSKFDFAVLTLDRDLPYDDHVQPACLPYEPIKDGENSQCYIVGLGVTRYKADESMEMPNIVQKMRVQRTSCKNWGFRHDDRSRHCFTKNGGKGDSCTGDSGGPILCLSKSKRWTVNGLVSYGSDHCDGTEQTGWVGVYTRVRAILPQIARDCQL